MRADAHQVDAGREGSSDVTQWPGEIDGRGNAPATGADSQSADYYEDLAAKGDVVAAETLGSMYVALWEKVWGPTAYDVLTMV